jgi:hypothetical protein
VPDGFAGTAHAHGEGEESENSHAIGIAGHQGLVDADTGEVIDVTRLGKTNDGMDQHIGLARPRSADSQLAMRAVHGVPRLEGHDLLPAQLVKVQTQLGRRVPQPDIVVVLQTVNSLDLAADVELLDRVVQVLDSRMCLVVVAKHLGGLPHLVRLVDVVDGDDGEVAVVAEVAQRNARAGLHADLIDGLLRHVEGDGHGKEIAICETVLGDNALVVFLVQEAWCIQSGAVRCNLTKRRGVANSAPR